jgi:Zn finger protein HypA/HybF involved in hydrogenase expression
MSDEPVPTFQPVELRCKCGHEWTTYVPSNVPVKAAVAYMRTIRCPQCGSARAFLRAANAETAEAAP